MIKCELCEQTTEPGARTYRIPSRTREKKYPRRAKVNKFGYTKVDDPGGTGWEIAAETRVCGGCFVRDRGLGVG